MTTYDTNGRRCCTVDTGGSDDVFQDALVLWMHVPRGGYGYTVPVPARVVIHGRRPYTWVLISPRKADGREGRTVQVNVSALRWER